MELDQVFDVQTMYFADFPFATFSLASQNTLRHPEVRDKVPTLLQALELWKNHGDVSYLLQRAQVLWGAQIPNEAIQLAYNISECPPFSPFIPLRHTPIISAHDSQQVIQARVGEISDFLKVLLDSKIGNGNEALIKQILEDILQGLLPLPLKTLTLQVSESGFVLLCGIGDYQISKQVKALIADTLGQTGKARKRTRNASLNRNFDTAIRLGQIPGIVGPFFPPHLIGCLDCIFYLKEETLSDSRLIAVAASPIDTFLITNQKFFEIFTGWYDHICLDTVVHTIPSSSY